MKPVRLIWTAFMLTKRVPDWSVRLAQSAPSFVRIHSCWHVLGIQIVLLVCLATLRYCCVVLPQNSVLVSGLDRFRSLSFSWGLPSGAHMCVPVTSVLLAVHCLDLRAVRVNWDNLT